MSHQSQMEFFHMVFTTFPASASAEVLDVGSLDINGGPHELLTARSYVGVDLGIGRNVDLVARGEDLDFPEESFSLTMSSECFEHNPMWVETLANMVRMTKRGGVIAVSCATTGRAEHGTARSNPDCAPLAVSQGQDFYKNVTASKFRLVASRQGVTRFIIVVNRRDCDLYFVGLKEPSGPEQVFALENLREALSERFGALPYNGNVVRRILVSTVGDTGSKAYEWMSRKSRSLRP